MKKVLLYLFGILGCIGIFAGIAAFSIHSHTFTSHDDLPHSIIAHDAESVMISAMNESTRSHLSNEDTFDDETETEILYVLNTSSKKIHKSNCSGADKILEKNKSFTDDFDEAIKDGFVPCKICWPES